MMPSTNTNTNQSSSIYDNIPYLDSWYQCKPKETYKVVPCSKKRKSCSNTVSFSTTPPAVYCYDDQKDEKSGGRPLHRRHSSSEQVKELLKHYTSKLSRQLSTSSSRSGFRA